MVEQLPSKDYSTHFRIKAPSKSIGNTYIQEIVQEFVDIDPTSQTLCVKFDEQDKFIGASYQSGVLRIFNSYTGKQVYMIVNHFNMYENEQKQSINCFRFRPSSHSTGVGQAKDLLVGVTTDGRVQYWHYTINKCAHQILPPENQQPLVLENDGDDERPRRRKLSAQTVDNTLNCLDFNCTLTKLAVGGNDAKIKIYDEHSHSKDYLMTLKSTGNQYPGHSKRIFALKFDTQQENILYSGGWDDTVQINDLREGGPVSSIYGPHVCGESIDVIDNLLIAGSYRNQKNLVLFDLRNSSKPLQYLEMDNMMSSSSNYFSECQIYTTQFYKQMKANSNQILASGCTGGRNEVKFFEAAPSSEEEKEGDFTGKFKSTYSITDFSGGVQTLDFSNRNNRVAVGTASGLVASFKLKIN